MSIMVLKNAELQSNFLNRESRVTTPIQLEVSPTGFGLGHELALRQLCRSEVPTLVRRYL